MLMKTAPKEVDRPYRKLGSLSKLGHSNKRKASTRSDPIKQMSKLCQQKNMEWMYLQDFRDKYLLVMHCRVSDWITGPLKEGAQIFCTSPILAAVAHTGMRLKFGYAVSAFVMILLHSTA